MSANNLYEKIQENNIGENILNNGSADIKRSRIKRIVLIAAPVLIIIFAVFILRANWNIIQGARYCKNGDYETAKKYYAEAMDNSIARKRHKALSAYLFAEEAYKNDNMEKLHAYIDTLHECQSEYPTKEEMYLLEEKYKNRIEEISTYEKSIEKILELFNNEEKIDTIKIQCDELLSKSITVAQKEKINDVKNNAINYTDIKNSFNSKKYDDVLKKVSKLSDTYKNYPTRDSIDKMKNESQKIIDERKSIDAKLKSVRDSFNKKDFSASLAGATELLKMNLSPEERTEIEKIKSTSEQSLNAQKKQYPEPEEYSINGASTNVKGMAEVKNAVKKVAKENQVYLRYIETEVDGSLYMEISCKGEKSAALDINNKITKAIKGCGYNKVLSIVYTDIDKGVDEANRVIVNADIYSDGKVDVYGGRDTYPR